MRYLTGVAAAIAAALGNNARIPTSPMPVWGAGYFRVRMTKPAIPKDATVVRTKRRDHRDGVLRTILYAALPQPVKREQGSNECARRVRQMARGVCIDPLAIETFRGLGK